MPLLAVCLLCLDGGGQLPNGNGAYPVPPPVIVETRIVPIYVDRPIYLPGPTWSSSPCWSSSWSPSAAFGHPGFGGFSRGPSFPFAQRRSVLDLRLGIGQRSFGGA